MKALWQALSLLASNDVFRTNVKAASDVEIREDQPTEPVDLQPQPTFQALQKIDDLFRKKELYLSAYELGEINRWVRYRKGVEPVAEMWRILAVKLMRGQLEDMDSLGNDLDPAEQLLLRLLKELLSKTQKFENMKVIKHDLELLLLQPDELDTLNRLRGDSQTLLFQSEVESQINDLERLLKQPGELERFGHLKDRLQQASPDFMAAIGAMAIDSELRFRAWYEETNKRDRLSQAVALLAEDTKFKKDVKDVKETAEPGADQPKALQDFETLFRGKNLCLSAHELSEIKTWSDDPRAIGAESFSKWYEQRKSQDGSNPILRNHGFKLSRDEEVVLTELYPGGPADNLCKQFFLDIWGGYPCTSLTIVYPGWVHSNA